MLFPFRLFQAKQAQLIFHGYLGRLKRRRGLRAKQFAQLRRHLRERNELVFLLKQHGFPSNPPASHGAIQFIEKGRARKLEVEVSSAPDHGFVIYH